MDSTQEQISKWTMEITSLLPAGECTRVREALSAGMPELLGKEDKGEGISKETRINALKAIEDTIQKVSSSEEYRTVARVGVTLYAPKFFTAIYEDYKIPLERQKIMGHALRSIPKVIHDHPELEKQILDPKFDSYSLSQKKELLEEIMKTLTQDSRIKGLYEGQFDNQQIIEVGSDYDIKGGSNNGNKISIGDGKKSYFLGKFFHEFWHNRQERTASWEKGSFEDLVKSYYVNEAVQKNPKWNDDYHGGIRNDYVYRRQPKEMEAWLIGVYMKDSFIKDLTGLKEKDKWSTMTSSSSVALDAADQIRIGGSVDLLAVNAFLNKFQNEMNALGETELHDKVSKIKPRDILDMRFPEIDSKFPLDQEQNLSYLRDKEKKLETFFQNCPDKILTLFAEKGYPTAQEQLYQKAKILGDSKSIIRWAGELSSNILLEENEQRKWWEEQQVAKKESVNSLTRKSGHSATIMKRLSEGMEKGKNMPQNDTSKTETSAVQWATVLSQQSQNG